MITCNVDEFQDHCDNYDGICLACQEWSCGGVEPDAEGYICESCNEPSVKGAEQAFMDGDLDITE